MPGRVPPRVPPRATIVKVVGCVVGVVGSLLVYGILQERIMTTPYDDGGAEESFAHSVFLVLCNRVVAASVAAAALVWTRGAVRPVAPAPAYAIVSASNVVATTCQYEALKYVSFPAQTMAKSAKILPALAWGVAVNGRSYGAKDYLVALGVALGCAAFATTGEESESSRNGARGATSGVAAWGPAYGVALMLAYLAVDGFTSALQDELFRGRYRTENVYNQMLWVNAFSAAGACAWMTLWDASMGAAIGFVRRHPAAFADCVALSLASTCGQLCILYTIREFGAVLFATIMTTRQVLSILLSNAIYARAMTSRRWLGAALVFASLQSKALDFSGGGGGGGGGARSKSAATKSSNASTPRRSARTAARRRATHT